MTGRPDSGTLIVARRDSDTCMSCGRGWAWCFGGVYRCGLRDTERLSAWATYGAAWLVELWELRGRS